MSYLKSRHCDWLHIAAVEMNLNFRMREDQFVSLFGLSSTTISRIYYVYLLDSELWRPQFILWTFNYLKTYDVRRNAHTSFRNASENIFRMKVWEVITLLYSEMDEVLFIYFDIILAVLNFTSGG